MKIRKKVLKIFNDCKLNKDKTKPIDLISYLFKNYKSINNYSCFTNDEMSELSDFIGQCNGNKFVKSRFNELFKFYSCNSENSVKNHHGNELMVGVDCLKTSGGIVLIKLIQSSTVSETDSKNELFKNFEKVKNIIDYFITKKFETAISSWWNSLYRNFIVSIETDNDSILYGKSMMLPMASAYITEVLKINKFNFSEKWRTAIFTGGLSEDFKISDVDSIDIKISIVRNELPWCERLYCPPNSLNINEQKFSSQAIQDLDSLFLELGLTREKLLLIKDSFETITNEDIEKFYHDYSKYYQSKDISKILSCYSKNWSSKDKLNYSDLNLMLKKDIENFIDIEAIASLKLPNAKPDSISKNKKEISYDFIITKTIAKTTHTLKYEIIEHIEKFNGKIEIVYTQIRDIIALF